MSFYGNPELPTTNPSSKPTMSSFIPRNPGPTEVPPPPKAKASEQQSYQQQQEPTTQKLFHGYHVPLPPSDDIDKKQEEKESISQRAPLPKPRKAVIIKDASLIFEGENFYGL